MKIHNKKRGFTLVELMVVCAIIAILSGVVLVAISGSKAKARDGKRISDVAQIQLALEQYFDHGNNAYPSLSSGLVPTYISVLPTPPGGGNYSYGINAQATDYLISALLENSGSLPVDRITTSNYGVTCTGNNYCLGPK